MAARTVSTLGGSTCAGHRDGPATSAMFNTPSDLVLSRDGSVFIAENGSHRIRKIDSHGIVSSVAGTGRYGLQDGPAMTARFCFPNALALSPNEDFVYIVDGTSNALRRLDLAQGLVTTLVGEGREKGRRGGSYEEARFNEPRGLAVDKKGNLYLSDTCTLYHIDLLTEHVRIIAGSDVAGDNDGAFEDVQFNKPDGLLLLDDSTLIVLDSYNHRLRRVDLARRVVTTLAGAGTSGYRDGTFSEALFKYPQKVSYDPQHQRVFVSELNDVIRVLCLKTRTVSTLAGSSDPGYQDGSPSSARFSFPSGLAWSAHRRCLLVADSDNHCIRAVHSQAGPDGVGSRRNVACASGRSGCASVPELDFLRAQNTLLQDKLRDFQERNAALVYLLSSFLEDAEGHGQAGLHHVVEPGGPGDPPEAWREKPAHRDRRASRDTLQHQVAKEWAPRESMPPPSARDEVGRDAMPAGRQGARGSAPSVPASDEEEVVVLDSRRNRQGRRRARAPASLEARAPERPTGGGGGGGGQDERGPRPHPAEREQQRDDTFTRRGHAFDVVQENDERPGRGEERAGAPLASAAAAPAQAAGLEEQF